MKPLGHRPCKETAAFTLMKLLVVIAIIGILPALLMPAPSAANKRTHPPKKNKIRLRF